MQKEARYPIRRKPQSDQDRLSELLSAKDDFQLRLEIKSFPSKGRGVVATKDFQKGEFIVQYYGQLISKQEASQREKAYEKDGKGCYLLQFEHEGKKLFIDATAEESCKLGRLLNHSRLHPNCAIKKVVASGHPYIVIVAKDFIPCGTELTWDYHEHRKEILDANPWLKE
jgi:histone-lysine N-methyltransferase SETD8